MVPSMRTATPDVYGRISALIRADARNGSEWALLLGLKRQALHDRLKGRTRWTLCDAVAIAAALGVSLDSLVGDEDLDLGYTLDTTASDEEVAAELEALTFAQAPDYDEVEA